MTNDMIKKLMAAGVAPDIILNLHLEDAEEALPATAEQEAQAAEPTAQAAEKEARAAAEPAAQAGMDQVLLAINKLTGAIQAGNIAASYHEHKALTADDAIATILKGGNPNGEENAKESPEW